MVLNKGVNQTGQDDREDTILHAAVVEANLETLGVLHTKRFKQA